MAGSEFFDGVDCVLDSIGEVLRLEVAEDGSLEVPEGASVEAVVSTFAIDAELKRYLPVAVNGQLVERSRQLQEGDELSIWLPAAGG